MKSIYVCGFLAVAVTLTGCARSSGVMDMGNGNYAVSAHASPIRGGATGAVSVAYKSANAFCAQHYSGTHAIVSDSQERDVYQASAGGSWNRNGGSMGGGIFASGNSNLRFRCGR